MAQSPELAGGEGFTFEGDCAAFYLAALLAEAYAPGIDDRTVVRVSVQQRDFGEPLDDVIVDFEDAAKSAARLSLQVKRSLTISKAKTNTDFREIIRDSWATLKKGDFRLNVDRYGTAVGTVTPAKERALKTLCDWARESLDAEHFDARFAVGGSAGADIKTVREDVATLLEEATGAKCTTVEVHQFLAHFVLIQLDLLREGATDPPEAINRIRDCLAIEDAAKAPLVWSRVVQLARASAGKSGQFDRTRLVRLIAPLARLRGTTSFRLDLDKLTEIAKSYANQISDDVGGTKLDRNSLLADLSAKLTRARIVQVRGLPGSGKSVVVKRAVLQALQRGPVLFLKAEQLEGNSWISYATAQGLSVAPLDQFLVEVGAAGTPTFFIDAIDRIEKLHQPVVLDVVRAIVNSPLLDNWRVVVSLRDTGIEVLRNWLGDLLNVVKVETLNIDQLNDYDAEVLAKAKPNLRPLLFGSTHVKEIVRRPFFAKVLHQSYVNDPSAPTFAPQSEVDLLENWWRRGGYNETGQSAIERQLALLNLARVCASQLSQPISLDQLTSVAHINDLKSDGILKNAREGISVRFSHDIFFEWAFFHVLAARGSHWIDEIKMCGEPPAVARVVELASQWEYAQQKNWAAYLAQSEVSHLRSQWLRAWLIGPLGTAGFEVDEVQFAMAVFADDFRLFRKALVWFQAEKTAPNTNILVSELPQEQRQRFADFLGWPSDFAAWRRLIDFMLRRISDIPQRLYPEIVAIFEVWQNARASVPNPTSRAILNQCATWLASLDATSTEDRPSENSAFWGEVLDPKAFRKSIGGLILKASRAEPEFAAEYLQRVIHSERIRDDAFGDIVAYSPFLAQSLPHSVVELSLAFLRDELPDDQVSREEQEHDDADEMRNAILAKPEAERTRKDKLWLEGLFSSYGVGDFGDHDWERLSINDNFRGFWPPSPLREPFHSLFNASPDEALRFFRELCNHAMSAWQQLHRHSRYHSGTPIPLTLKFPWGEQRFWGNEREYLWFRSTWAPKAIGCGFMALEEWCFAQLERGRTVDELIQQVVEGNDCIAILGVASMLALHTETVSEATLPLLTSQRLLAADHNRFGQDLSSTANLIGFMRPTDLLHAEAVQTANARQVRKTQLRYMVPRFMFAAEPIRERTRKAILNFINDLPYEYEEQRNIPEVCERLKAQALQYTELAEPKNYQAYRTQADSDQVAIYHVSPSAAEPENVAKAEEATEYLRLSSLWMWASKYFDGNALDTSFTVDGAIALARRVDAAGSFVASKREKDDMHLEMQRSAVAAATAIALNCREGRSTEDLDWARDALVRAVKVPERSDRVWPDTSIIPWHPSIFAARGFAADMRSGIIEHGAAVNLLGLVAHPLEAVSLTALAQTCTLWRMYPKLTWAALFLAFSLCHAPRRPRGESDGAVDTPDATRTAEAAVTEALTVYESGREWVPLPLPPPAWVKVTPTKRHHSHQIVQLHEGDDDAMGWDEPDVFWYSTQAAKFLSCIPLFEVLNSSAKAPLLDFIEGVLDWTNKKIAPPWAKSARRNLSATSILQWTDSLGVVLGRLAGLRTLVDFRPRFLDPVLKLEDDKCWDLLAPFARSYICAYVYDAPVVPADAVATLDLCLGRLLQSSTFNRDAYRSGEFSGFNQPELVRTLMFVSVESAPMAARYVNGDWSEIARILPLIDRFVRAGGWSSSVMDVFLTLCERTKVNYPAQAFGDQVLAILGEGTENLKGWHGTFNAARIAELVQYFAHRDAPMALALAQKFLRILDMLVDMGDRRSAALQLGEAFREIRLPL